MSLDINQPKGNRGAVVFPLFMLFCYIVAKPFYFFESGLPQFADIFAIVVIVVLLLSSPGLKIGNLIITFHLLLMAIVITVVSGVWAIKVSDLNIIFPILFFIFNFLLFLAVSHIISRQENALKYILWAVIVGVLVQIVLLPFSLDIGFRQSLFFNNPNQLGYWAILSAGLFLYMVQYVPIPKVIYVLFTFGVMFLAALSLSKAAMVSIMLLYFLYYGNRPAVIVVFLLTMSAVFIYMGEVEQVSNVIDRLSDLGSSEDDNAAGRGYDRIWLIPEHLWFGYGEGAFYRFFGTLKGPGATHELHSTLGALFFSYGPLGLFIFVAMFIRLFFSRGLSAVLPFIPIFAYSLTHLGFRFSLFWLLLSVVSTDYDGQSLKDKNLK